MTNRNPARTRIVQRMRGGTPEQPEMRHTAQVIHAGRSVFEGHLKQAERVMEKLRYGSAAITELFTYADGI